MIGIAIYTLIINVISFVLFGIDKQFAKSGRRRIPEATLIGAALLGGSAGAYISMGIFRHKTRKPKFFVGVPVILVIQFLLLAAAGYICIG